MPTEQRSKDPRVFIEQYRPHPCCLVAVAGKDFEGDEDCLYLHVWAPEGANATEPLPVMLWIYGGSVFLTAR